jgi:hypothetical protein
MAKQVRKQGAKRCIVRGCNARIRHGTRSGSLGKGVKSYFCNNCGVADRRIKMIKIRCGTIGCNSFAGICGYCRSCEPKTSPIKREYIIDNTVWKGLDLSNGVTCLYCSNKTNHDFACDECRLKITEGFDN